MTRVCGRCHLIKPVDSFYKSKRSHHPGCKQCRAEWDKQHYNPTKQKGIDDRKRKRNPIQWLLRRAKTRAKKKNIPFDITPADIETPTYCPVFGMELDYLASGGSGRQTYNTASLDRIIPSKGYVKGNVEVISWRANVLKRDATHEELEKVAAYCKSRCMGLPVPSLCNPITFSPNEI